MSPKVAHVESSYEGTYLLEGRHALITAADSGIRGAVAMAFARERADVAVSYLSEQKDARGDRPTGEHLRKASEQESLW
jgi:NAD(P)-dependent dehydrogenase (short-subunit alcohol dehydrogenase family)